ncbi:MAG: alpha-1,3-fucosyltransferase [Thermodesulfobacteriota bacterium]|nr:MAG: alpha-1,3-fucosyltransferase [Thermodesulfobacteriota bacterium]
MDRAAAVVFHIPTLSTDLLLKENVNKKKDQIWVAWSMESDSYYPIMMDRHFMSHFDMTMTYHLDSDIPVPYVTNDFTDLIKHTPSPKKPENIANTFISRPLNKSGRIQLLMQLMGHIQVDSYGELLNTHILNRDKGRQTKMDIISQYKFTLAFENSISTDYVTEKFYEPLIAGSVPVYLGAPNIEDFSPGENCFIDASKWDNPESLAAYLQELSYNEELYQRYFDWRERPLKKKFLDLLNINLEHAFVRLCNRISEMPA